MANVNIDNSKITFQGKPLAVVGKGLKVGDVMPSFTLTAQDMSDLKSTTFVQKPLVISTVPSLDTPTCSIQTKHFNKAAEKLSSDVTILTVSRDLPFAQKRWCGNEGVTKVVTGSDYKYQSFAEAFGLLIKDWSLLARAVFVVDRNGKIAHIEYVPNISDEPNYEAALAVLSNLIEKR